MQRHQLASQPRWICCFTYRHPDLQIWTWLKHAACAYPPDCSSLADHGTYCDIKSCELATVVLDVIKVEPMMDIVYKDGRLWASLQQLLTDRYT